MEGAAQKGIALRDAEKQQQVRGGESEGRGNGVIAVAAAACCWGRGFRIIPVEIDSVVAS